MIGKQIVMTILLLLCGFKGYPGEKGDSLQVINRNKFYINVGFVELINLNYERALLWYPLTSTHIKIGAGYFNDLQGGGTQYKASWVQLFGKKGSHLEINMGVIYYVNSKENSNPLVKSYGIDRYVGYRYEKPDGHFVFRFGFIYPIIWAAEIGLGFKF